MNSQVSDYHQSKLDALQRAIQYQFRQPELLIQAMTHRSYAQKNYERLEFIGDSILNYTIAKMLFEAFPQLPEGRLSRIRANLVNQETLAKIARELQIGSALFLGPGELKSGGADRASILADAMEALFAAVSLDENFNRAETLVRSLFRNRIHDIDLSQSEKDAKTQLQEALQHLHLPLPRYRIESVGGETPRQVFDVTCDLGETAIQTEASGNCRRVAEQLAAQKALVLLKKRYPELEKTLKN